ncbi:hypothetical protein IFM89_004577 [Coptis chinensis]|uniref:Uncharacterized protein n=1 Tax=Coptis chinensis TaxID=261450 RepID=A0A835H6K7_9MAGN|nr:hypothetical protein IFM89_004577 [Coptis chinensis]
MNPMSFSPPPWYIQPNPVISSSFWVNQNVHNHLKQLRDTIHLAKTMKKELEVLVLSKENSGTLDIASDDVSVHLVSEILNGKGVSLEMQESQSLEAANSLLSVLKGQLEPLNVLMSQTSAWEEKSAAVRLSNKIHKYKRNKLWRKRKRKHIAEMVVKEREKFDQVDQEADDWRAREIAKDIAQRKVEKMKEIAKLKANEERKRLESELELVLIVEKLQELRSIRIQKLKKQDNHHAIFSQKRMTSFLSGFELLSRKRSAKQLLLLTQLLLKRPLQQLQSRGKQSRAGPDPKDNSGNETGGTVSQGQLTEASNEKVIGEAAELKSQQQDLDAQNSAGAYDSVASLPLEFYHYYHGSNTDMGTLIEVRRTWDAYIRPGGSRIPGHWVQPPPPANDIWASFLVEHK